MFLSEDANSNKTSRNNLRKFLWVKYMKIKWKRLFEDANAEKRKEVKIYNISHKNKNLSKEGIYEKYQFQHKYVKKGKEIYKNNWKVKKDV